MGSEEILELTQNGLEMMLTPIKTNNTQDAQNKY